MTMQHLTNAQRQYLRRLAHQLKPMVQIGKQGLTEGVRMNVDQALETHELIKVKFLEFQDEKEALTDELIQTTESVLIGLIGNVATLYRQQPDPEKRKIRLPS